MARKFSLKLYTGFEHIDYLEVASINKETDELEFEPVEDRHCITFKEYSFNEEISKPIYDVGGGREDVHNIYTEKK